MLPFSLFSLQGVVQNCRGSFMRICQCLFHSLQPCLHSLPSTWLNEMLNTVSSTSSVTSITRRRFVCAPSILDEEVITQTNQLERTNLPIKEIVTMYSSPLLDGMLVLPYHGLFFGLPTNSHAPFYTFTYRNTHILGTKVRVPTQTSSSRPPHTHHLNSVKKCYM